MANRAVASSYAAADHPLLAPTYIRDSSNFIMDVFPKSETSATAGTDALAADLHFPSSIFHFVNKQNQTETPMGNVIVRDGTSGAAALDAQSATATSLVTVNSSDNDFDAKHTEEFISLNTEFLDGGDNKNFCYEASDNHEDATETVQQFPSLSLLAAPNVSLEDSEVIHDDAGDVVMYARSSARKVLPHKKRISRKLKVPQGDVIEIGVESMLPVPLEHDKIEERLVVEAMAFSCQICGHSTATQLDFFAHLKQHYEPTISDTILDSMKTLEPTKVCNDICSMSKKADNTSVEQVFNDVHLNFEDFHNVNEPVSHVMAQNQSNEINSPDISKCINYGIVTQMVDAPPKAITPDEVEFSDTEDMLEGIRNVVDKVSIEDTCDDIDLMVPNGIRSSWFANDTFSGIPFKSRPFSDVSFSESLAQMPVLETPTERIQMSVKIINPEDERLRPKESVDIKIEQMEKLGSDALYATQHCLKNEIVQGDDIAVLQQPLSTTITQKQAKDKGKSAFKNESQYKEFIKYVDGVQEDNDDEEAEVINEVELDEDYNNDYNNDDDDYTPTDLKVSTKKNSKKIRKGSNCKKQYICKKCDREFNSSNALKYHVRRHTGERPHQCHVCGNSFFAQGALNSHMRTHTGDKPYECKHCPRKFGQWSDLNYHTVSIHTEEKSHQCEFCGKSFSRKYSLVLHRRIHTSERNYKCEYCGKTFRASTYLQNHRKIHTGEKPYECEVCKKRFRMSSDYRRHLRTHQRYIKADDKNFNDEPKL